MAINTRRTNMSMGLKHNTTENWKISAKTLDKKYTNKHTSIYVYICEGDKQELEDLEKKHWGADKHRPVGKNEHREEKLTEKHKSQQSFKQLHIHQLCSHHFQSNVSLSNLRKSHQMHFIACAERDSQFQNERQRNIYFLLTAASIILCWDVCQVTYFKVPNVIFCWHMYSATRWFFREHSLFSGLKKNFWNIISGNVWCSIMIMWLFSCTATFVWP